MRLKVFDCKSANRGHIRNKRRRGAEGWGVIELCKHSVFSMIILAGRPIHQDFRSLFPTVGSIGRCISACPVPTARFDEVLNEDKHWETLIALVGIPLQRIEPSWPNDFLDATFLLLRGVIYFGSSTVCGHVPGSQW